MLKYKNQLLAVLLSALLVSLSGCSDVKATNRGMDKSRYVQSFTDPETGCKYLTTLDGGITPRMHNQKHIGCKAN